MVSHLQAKKSGILHKAIDRYLSHLYSNYWEKVESNVGHKGLFNQGDTRYKQAVAAEEKFRTTEHDRLALARNDDNESERNCKKKKLV